MSGTRFWAVVPAAGVGRRMGSATPKQYLSLNGRAVIERTLETLLTCPHLEAVYVALSPEDDWWPQLKIARDPRVVRVDGGVERCDSVLNALQVMQSAAAREDWVLVHDAARPCLRPEDLDSLIQRLREHPVGGLLGVPVRDTMKRTGTDNRVSDTVSRDSLWHAYTPQMFRLGVLLQALEQARAKGVAVTDDASAIELAGMTPLMIEGHDDNIKITRPEDLALAGFYLQQQGKQ
jgi:2-C-methyl-D-erythritol 4-phosphate cytidylyltransferase